MRFDALRRLAAFDKSLYRGQMLAAVKELPAEGWYDELDGTSRFSSALVADAGPTVWNALAERMRAFDSLTRANLIDSLGPDSWQNGKWTYSDERMRLLRSFAPDATPLSPTFNRFRSSLPRVPNLTIGDLASYQLAQSFGLIPVFTDDKLPSDWAAIRAKTQAEVDRRLAKRRVSDLPPELLGGKRRHLSKLLAVKTPCPKRSNSTPSSLAAR